MKYIIDTNVICNKKNLTSQIKKWYKEGNGTFLNERFIKIMKALPKNMNLYSIVIDNEISIQINNSIQEIKTELLSSEQLMSAYLGDKFNIDVETMVNDISSKAHSHYSEFFKKMKIESSELNFHLLIHNVTKMADKYEDNTKDLLIIAEAKQLKAAIITDDRGAHFKNEVRCVSPAAFLSTIQMWSNKNNGLFESYLSLFDSLYKHYYSLIRDSIEKELFDANDIQYIHMGDLEIDYFDFELSKDGANGERVSYNSESNNEQDWINIVKMGEGIKIIATCFVSGEFRHYEGVDLDYEVIILFTDGEIKLGDNSKVIVVNNGISHYADFRYDQEELSNAIAYNWDACADVE